MGDHYPACLTLAWTAWSRSILARVVIGLALIPAAAGVTAPAHAGETITYSYDSRGRVTTVARTGTVDNMTTAYTFDNADNRSDFNSSGVTGGLNRAGFAGGSNS